MTDHLTHEMPIIARGRPSPVKTRGLSLVELMLAMAIGLILIAGMIAVFSGNKRSSDLNSAMADIQENARFAMNSIASEIRMSGFQGCMDLNFVTPTLLGNGLPTTDLQATAAMGSIIGNGNLWAPSPPTGFVPGNHEAIPGTHALTLQFGSPATYPLVQAVGSAGVPDTVGPVVVDTTPGISREEFNLSSGEFGIISDCNGADIFQITKVTNGSNTATIEHGASANSSGSFSRIYAGGSNSTSKFMRFVSSVYYVGETDLTNSNGDPITSLYRQSLPYNTPDNPAIEVVRGVEDMRISFGIRTGTESLTYVLASDSLYNPRQVESIRIGLLLNSFDRISQNDDTNTYVIAGQLIEPEDSSSSNAAGTHSGDKRFRLAFNTTVKVRNRRTRQ
ncbi:PilW family protein [Granulosicoccus antarcticus]|uniref:Type IV pilus assembly protein PilW n=1 Tax=Granulosicoccus antarcticus IMCC3135 TaxID=1192854 RepID=A0A2Z2NPK7_9GAMM|nr:PilW family protein [Granulosicoccus antarcticus]ASJ72395.1 hypothetical protein IMCC3135_11525 [Granulosicoccus antarcticus IMCC3135]